MGIHFAEVWTKIIAGRPVKDVIPPKIVHKGSASRYKDGLELPRKDKLERICRALKGHAPAILDAWARDKAEEQWQLARDVAADCAIVVELKPENRPPAVEPKLAEIEVLLDGLGEDKLKIVLGQIEALHASGVLGTIRPISRKVGG